jgi:putative tricarboxylic transport membrane protein
MKRAHLIASIVLLALSGYVIKESLKMKLLESYGPGVGFFPFWLGVILALLAMILIVKNWRLPTGANDRSPFANKKAVISVSIVMAALAAYIILMEWIGFISNTILFVAFLLKVLERERWLVTLPVSVMTAATLYIIFQVLLGIKLPANAFGF